MYQTSDFRKGLILLIDQIPYVILDFQHYKPGKGNQFTRTKLRNLISGAFLEKTIKSGEKFGIPDVSFKEMNFLYSDASGYHFMSPKDYEQITLDQVSKTQSHFLTENLEVKVCFFNNKIIDIELPKLVVLKVKETEPGLKRTVASASTKTAKTETGAVIQVPMHIKEGDQVRVNTQTYEYVDRIRK